MLKTRDCQYLFYTDVYCIIKTLYSILQQSQEADDSFMRPSKFMETCINVMQS